MKSQGFTEGIIYIHLNTKYQYTISYGIDFHDFVRSLSKELNHLLLLKHEYDKADFNMNTRMNYVEAEEIPQLLKEPISEYSGFCWIDFDDIEGLNELEGREVAELLYLGHCKNHLKLPFYSKLNNRYVYLSEADKWMNKTYYRYLPDFYFMLGHAISFKLGFFKVEKSIFSLKKGDPIPPVPKEMISSFADKMKEGMVVSLPKAMHNRLKLEVPVWVVGDYINMDEMFEEYTDCRQREPDGYFVFDKRAREWSIRFLND
ncbi:hypothetical protein [Bacillus thermotolerans]|uniref:Oxalate:formate antiporter n=1 Tax=Bacillus thermotolerans TaxID=1221996 RepID=A0A0F5I288_BACTR|nr:hypothetical protein [Bacillus thermotolerans]KKB38227.1 hypothetical protein QY97_02760 [Bacillus thermotolerans]KKB39735.1 hypothetical protein QY96_02707 [Bacillus thermotolerans]KKB39774.1 hypothetical protein QY95_01991 [Bacillus thermotolerans]